MKKSLLVSALIAVGALAAGAVQAQTVTVTPAHTYTTVTTAPFIVGKGADIPAGPDYPYPGAVVTTAAPALITTPALSTAYMPTPVVTFVSPGPGVATSSTTILGAGSSGLTSNVPLQAGEASTMTGGAPNLLTTNPYPISIVSGAPLVIYQY